MSGGLISCIFTTAYMLFFRFLFPVKTCLSLLFSVAHFLFFYLRQRYVLGLLRFWVIYAAWRFASTKFHEPPACGKFTKFTILVRLGTEMNWLDFEVKRLKGQAHGQMKYGPERWLMLLLLVCMCINCCIWLANARTTKCQRH